jgi:hypothetical protein
MDKPAPGYFFVNADQSIWASASWREQARVYPRASEEGNRGMKVAWFRPEGAELEISGRRIDKSAPPLEAYVPSGYPTRFQATGLAFPTEGCWQITAKAAQSELSFVVWVDP